MSMYEHREIEGPCVQFSNKDREPTSGTDHINSDEERRRRLSLHVHDVTSPYRYDPKPPLIS